MIGIDRFRRCALAGAAALLALGTSAARAEVKIGAPAPDFVAADSNGRSVALSALRGKIVVLEWNNPECPYVGKHYGTGNMQALQAEATGKGVVWLTVNSAARGKQGYMEGLEANKHLADAKAKPTAFLPDPKGSIGRAYGAVTTPHMFVIDATGKLAYMGAIDDKPTASHGDVKGARNYVREALAAVAEGKAPQVTVTRPYGCSVKYDAPRG